MYAARLRRVLGADRLRGVAPGYVLDLAGVDVDAARFEALLAGARDTLDRDPADGLQRIDAALALWRGAPYGELADEVPTLRVESTRLDELRLVALEPGCCWRGWRCSTTRSRCRR